MISIVICSKNEKLCERIRENIQLTIGVEYEMIVIANYNNELGICAAYNDGGSRARFSFICFVHEDVIFETFDWGIKICGYLQDPLTGLIGIAGGDAKSLVPSSWSVPIRSNEINVFQHYSRSMRPATHIIETADKTSLKQKVVALDGVLLCTRADVFKKIQFDAEKFPGFHGYDIDYSLQVGRSYSLYVIHDVVIHHYSEGTPGRRWVRSAIRISKKWQQQLPLFTESWPKRDVTAHHWKSLQVFLQQLIRLGYPLHLVIRYFLQYSMGRFFALRPFLSLSKFIFVKLRKRKRLKRG